MPSPQSVLLRRTQTVHLDSAPAPAADPRTAPRLVVLEAELLDRGYALTAPLHAAFAALDHLDLAREGRPLLSAVDELLGSHRPHTPLYQRFPLTVPKDSGQLYVDRVFALLLQSPGQRCVLCGASSTVHPVSPCAHLVCRTCWDGSDYSACPICHRRLDPADPFLTPVAPAPRTTSRRAAFAGELRLLSLGTDLAAASAVEARRLMGRQTPLSGQEYADLAALLPVLPAGLSALPEDIPVRETKALVLGTLLREPRTADAVRAQLRERLTTATDVLRLLCVHSGGNAAVLKPPRFRSLPRALRRELLAVLDGLHLGSLIEDLSRHPGPWKRAAERLHPYEQYARHPKAALAFAVLRESDAYAFPALRDLAAQHPQWVTVEDGRIRAVTWNGQVEVALAARELPHATRLLRQRPGELLRRLDHVLRLYEAEGATGDPAPLTEALTHALPRAGVGALLSAYGALRIRHRSGPGARRVFFPRGEVTRAFAIPEDRAPLPGALTARVCGLLEAEVLRRLAAREPYEHVLFDEALEDLNVPFAEHASAASLVAVPRGSRQPLPPGEVLRLFLHWTQPADTRVDLDLSVAFYRSDLTFAGLCDYTALRHLGGAAVHSGDLTSAPAPAGATEYVDLELPLLAHAGIAYALPVVFSFNNIPFEKLPDAFAGFMEIDGGRPRDSSYDPRTVRQRFDLAGDSQVCVPMVVDLHRREALWTDLHLPPAAGFQSIASHTADLGRITRDLLSYFASGSRTTLGDLARWHAAARAPEATVVRREGALWTYRRGSGESAAAFAARLAALEVPQEYGTSADLERLLAGKRVLVARVHGEPVPEKASGTAYRLFPGPVDGHEDVTRVTAGDLVAELGPQQPEVASGGVAGTAAEPRSVLGE
ncbi:MXAN_6230/SCO0854 family RING domain-containing protein [Streptomyces finlayi]|uniref:MXAN_6230/SCO0854 family RING domain-containing protein n=1 Tax=Streptomyces finlayi TaxID=67296 RepID=UPI00167359C0|nr:MXAN_6230/SCO0854 family RING domain-containing protein [Streptomyces finlayi]